MSSLEDLIPLVNRLQDLVFNTIGSDTLDLPQVVVVGSQSCGKSSVLENIVGRDFLPRGTGIVTRRPLILQLINIPTNGTAATPIPNDSYSASNHSGNQTNSSVSSHGADLQPILNENNSQEWGEFLHIPGRKFYDFAEIRREIESETARIAGSNKGINRLPINLKIFSSHVLNLTLVDLPGLTKIPIGDQPTDIERQTRNLILEYIAKPNSIILAVSPANVDLVNSESLKLARQIDPQGKRTIGILTKIDLMDHGTNALDILSGRVYPLKLGFIGVINRSQQDIHANKCLRDSLQAEKEYFLTHPAYKNISHRCGTQFLAKSLNQTLMSHIRERLPDIKAKLNTLMGQTEQELHSYGDKAFSSPQSRGTLILQLMTKFATTFVSSIDGTASEISTKELCGGARIYYIYNEVFGSALSSIHPTSNLSITDIRTAIRNSTGPRPSLFVPELAFDLLVKPQIKLLEPPSQRCVELVYEELMKICHNCGSVDLSRYPKLQTKLIEVVSDLLRERLGPTSQYVESLISIQRAYINTNHPNFLGAASAMAGVMEERKLKEKVEKDELRKTALSKMNSIKGEGSISHLVNNSENNNSDDYDDIDDNEEILIKHKRQPSHIAGANGSVSSSNGELHSKDSFLNYFFGKDGSNPGSIVANGNPSGLKNVKLDQSSFSSNQYMSFNPNPTTAVMDTLNQQMDVTALNDLDEPILSDREQLECELIRRLITSYFDIVREIIQDQVPKAVMHLLVNFSKESVQNRLVSELYKESLFDELLMEDEGLAQERSKCEKMLKTYREATKIIGEVL
ncbi:hypothetical protein NADFUDRAFT_46605 [Nadsonia fulvescens var. elongata DSM 6958]|uniref:dynamin GTPase n=1 Tax=Nadsonia fulvescens var. elongata DSM 6958 TaxID=857566 RepID=A0A1E3PKV7_9ASCO|nr:hypothetical protein NADFUDRAFT_46605 [Nadsonia fulvescens var. elongata DSM 6958]